MHANVPMHAFANMLIFAGLIFVVHEINYENCKNWTPWKFPAIQYVFFNNISQITDFLWQMIIMDQRWHCMIIVCPFNYSTNKLDCEVGCWSCCWRDEVFVEQLEIGDSRKSLWYDCNQCWDTSATQEGKQRQPQWHVVVHACTILNTT